ncbi:MAG: iron-regulated protein [Bacteroidetes bacterium HGW-Bacteroidetes-7]|jgi:uncharacterized iron-regulated protein|nr:MAG: iron-regulated protein [Bacteroidetes bacterium HGW-Bacteroidetes-7]
MKKILTLLLILSSIALYAQGNKKGETKTETYNNDFPAYVIYNNQGERVTYSQMVNSVITADIMLFGELHDDPISHWMELSLLKSFHSIKGDKLIVGAEMWESDNQLIMDEMLVYNLVDGKSYTESSKLWPNFATDYQPILQYVKSKNLPFICTNIPRRYARIVFQKGVEYLDSLSDQAKSYFPPLPIHFDLTQPAYKNMAKIFPTDEEFEMKQQQESKSSSSAMHGSKPSNLVKAQAIKDATMAYFILKNWKPGMFFYHFNGEYHSAFHDSIVYYLKYYNPDINVKTISIIKQSSVMNFDKKNSRANFNIVVPNDMAVTYISKPF